MTLEDCLAAFFAADELKGSLPVVTPFDVSRKKVRLNQCLLSLFVLQETTCTAVRDVRSEYVQSRHSHPSVH